MNSRSNVLMAPRPGEDADDVRIYRLVRVELTRATRGGDKTLLLLTDLSKSRRHGEASLRSCIGGGGRLRRCSSSWKRTCTRK